MRRTRIKRNEDGTFNLNIDLKEIDLKCLWHRLNQGSHAFLESYDGLDDVNVGLSEKEFERATDWFIWNAIDEILCDEDMNEYYSNNEGWCCD